MTRRATTTIIRTANPFNVRAIMRRAHNLLRNFRKAGVTFAQCLKRAWLEAKAARSFTLKAAHVGMNGRTAWGVKGASESQVRYMFDLLPSAQRRAMKAAYRTASVACGYYTAADVAAAISTLLAGRTIQLEIFA